MREYPGCQIARRNWAKAVEGFDFNTLKPTPSTLTCAVFCTGLVVYCSGFYAAKIVPKELAHKFSKREAACDWLCHRKLNIGPVTNQRIALLSTVHALYKEECIDVENYMFDYEEACSDSVPEHCPELGSTLFMLDSFHEKDRGTIWKAMNREADYFVNTYWASIKKLEELFKSRGRVEFYDKDACKVLAGIVKREKVKKLYLWKDVS